MIMAKTTDINSADDGEENDTDGADDRDGDDENDNDDSLGDDDDDYLIAAVTILIMMVNMLNYGRLLIIN